MRLSRLLAMSTALAAVSPTFAYAQDAAPADEAATADDGAIVVTARKREETLGDVPIAATAITGDTLASRGINSVREAAALAPGLSINSDGAGRAFIAIRGVGVTLVSTVQPGVGLFIDGVYQPNTSYLNNPLLDVSRIEVLRGPQGTLYGKNTLGGAINVITREPTNELSGRVQASYAGPDDAWLVSGSLSGALIEDTLSFRVAASHRQQDGFIRNTLLNTNGNTLNTDSVNATLRFTPSSDFKLTVKGYYDSVIGAQNTYSRITGTSAYTRDMAFNAPNLLYFKYMGINAKAEIGLGASTMTLISAYDQRKTRAPDSDVDFGPTNFARSTGNDVLKTNTFEARLDSPISDQLSSLVGLFYSRETSRAHDETTLLPAITGLPFNVVRLTDNQTKADTYAAFGTLFWKPSDAWEVALGLRFDHEARQAIGSVVTVLGPLGSSGGPLPQARISSDQVEPRLSITRNWSSELMTYASVARGYRGGGFNAPTAPSRTYKGDSAWTYELGSKFTSADRKIYLAGALFYNDYKDYIGLNSIAAAAGGGLVTVDLNSGDVESYGLELEAVLRPIPAWSISGGLTVMHARITDASAYTATTGRLLSSDRLTFQPDVMGNIATDYTIGLGGDSELAFGASATYKGKRLAATLNQTTPTFLDGYWLGNASVTFRQGNFELQGFVTNLGDTKYWESYIEKTTLQLAGLPASDLGIVGEGRRYGVRASFKF
ncbi:TonB-dependent receptor [Novosphingobium aquae]|uniref:TonB-dependent receptor n=1 Tax=Novosphingobium aquae TaxID=3133435 RepID=A0ABU8SCN9_9SPHN